MGRYTSEELGHLTTTVTRDAIIMGRNITIDGVHGEPLRQSANIGSRESGMEVMTKREMFCSTVELGGLFERLLDTFIADPTKVGLEQVEIIGT